MEKILEELQLPSPITEIHSTRLQDRAVRMFVKRDELIHPLVCGNKWRKLYGTLKRVQSGSYHKLITAGGAFSNHLVAVASCCRMLGLESKAYIRSYVGSVSNPTLDLLCDHGMEIEFCHPKEYASIRWEGPDCGPGEFWVPEGGASPYAVEGIIEMWTEICEVGELLPDYFVLAVGSGTTIAGLCQIIPASCTLMGIAPFRTIPEFLGGKQWLNSSVEVVISPCSIPVKFGAYHPVICQYVQEFYAQFGILLDPIYTARAMFNLWNQIELGEFPRGSQILFLHSGGLQGLAGYNFRFSKKGCELPWSYPA